VILILEPAGIARTLLDEGAERANSPLVEPETAAPGHEGQRVLLLMFRAGGAILKAIPLGFIARLEEFDRAAIEHSGGQALVLYQGRLMPIEGYSAPLDDAPSARQPVLVFHQNRREIGMAVDEIVDVIEAMITIDTNSARLGIVGTAIIEGKAVEIVDVSELIAPEGDTAGDGAEEPIDVLLIEPSEFFRAIFAPLLRNAGYRIGVVSTIAAARDLLARRMARIIVLDLDHDSGAGLGFVAEGMETNSPAPPVIGLVSRGSRTLIEKARTAGLADLVGKFDRQGLLGALEDVLSLPPSVDWEQAA
jgi:two-component system chemotaxis sensor kinase CheA